MRKPWHLDLPQTYTKKQSFNLRIFGQIFNALVRTHFERLLRLSTLTRISCVAFVNEHEEPRNETVRLNLNTSPDSMYLLLVSTGDEVLKTQTLSRLVRSHLACILMTGLVLATTFSIGTHRNLRHIHFRSHYIARLIVYVLSMIFELKKQRYRIALYRQQT